MPRLLLKHKGVLRHLASINVTHDGSITLNLVRNGVSEGGFQWSCGAGELGPLNQRETPEQKTKSITVHTTGRINYKFDDGHTRYVPCLLDLDGPVPIVLYSIPAIDRLDEVTTQRKDDSITDVAEEQEGRVNFTFDVLPAVLPPQLGEQGRFGVEGLYALSWSAHVGEVGATREGVPGEVFTTFRPHSGLPHQATPEEVVYLRFRRAMYANDVILAAENARNRDEITAEHIEAMIQAGPGLFPPNNDGVWTCLTSVPMRIAPRLRVDFKDPRYRAEVVDLRPGDTRLSTVRIRFKVFDERESRYVKELVEIHQILFDAEL
jgi:hypothetical protein